MKTTRSKPHVFRLSLNGEDATLLFTMIRRAGTTAQSFMYRRVFKKPLRDGSREIAISILSRVAARLRLSHPELADEIVREIMALGRGK